MYLRDSRILVTPTSFGSADPGIRAQLEASVGSVVYNTTGKPLKETDLLSIISDFDGYIAGLDEINAAVIAAAHRLKVISRYGVGVDNVDLNAARAHNIVVTNTPGANSASVAELTVGLLLSMTRNIPAAFQSMKSGKWPRLNGVSLEGKTVGLIGLGAIGRQTAQRLFGFGCHLLACDMCSDEAFADLYAVTYVSLTELLEKSDFILLHCPLNDQTRSMVNEDFLKKVKKGAFLVNTARGELIDNAALLAALESGVLRGAALDVFNPEPPDMNNPLFQLEQVITTPHTSSHTDEATNNMGRMTLHDCLAVLSGTPPLHPVI